MTDQELRDLVASLVLQQKETGEQIKETERAFKRMWFYVWNFIDNDWKVVEEYFFTALDKSNKLHWEDYNYFSNWEKYSLSKWREQEFDIIGYNWNKITAIEVKKIVHKNDVIKLVEKQLPFLKDYMSKNIDYKNHRIYWGIAGFKINKDAQKYAKEHWIIILTKNSENKIEELSKDFELKHI